MSDGPMLKQRANAWKSLPNEISNRLGNAVKSMRFLSWFILGYIVFGALGIWLSVILPLVFEVGTFSFESLNQNLFIYAWAILGTLVVDFVLDKDNNNKDMASLGLVLGVIAMFASMFGFFSDKYFWFLYVGTGLALILCLFANVNHDRFDSEQDQDIEAGSTGYDQANVDKIKDQAEES